MTECQHITFGVDNFMEVASLSSVPEPVTDINFLKNQFRARQTKWTNLLNDIVVDVVLPEQVFASFFTIAGHNFPKTTEINLQLFTNGNDTTPFHTTGFTAVGEMIPLGAWRAGIDPYAGLTDDPLSNIFSAFFGELYLIQKVKVVIRHNYGTATSGSTVIVSDGIFKQNDISGTVSIEAENADITGKFLDTWETVSDTDAGGGAFLRKSGDTFYYSANDGPKIDFTFTATVTGTYKVWARVESTQGNSVDPENSIYSVFQGAANIHTFVDIANLGWEWRHVKTITVTAGQVYTYSIAARGSYIDVDKIMIQPNADAAPTGVGEFQSGFGTTTQDNSTGVITTATNVAIRMMILGNTLELDNNFNYGSVVSFLTSPKRVKTHGGFSADKAVQNRVRALSLDLAMMSDNDRLNLQRLERNLGGRPFMFSAYPDRADWFRDGYAFVAKFDDALQYAHRFEGIHRTPLTLVEV